MTRVKLLFKPKIKLIRQAMLVRGYTAKDISDKTGLSRQCIYNILGGDVYPHSKTCYLIAESLDISVDDLFEVL